MLAAFCPLYLIASLTEPSPDKYQSCLGVVASQVHSAMCGEVGGVCGCAELPSAFVELGFLPFPSHVSRPRFLSSRELCFEPSWLVVVVAGEAASRAQDLRGRHLLLQLGSSLAGKGPQCCAPLGAGPQPRLDLLLSRQKPVSLGADIPLCRCAFASHLEGWIYSGINWMQPQIGSAGRAMIIKVPLILKLVCLPKALKLVR